jgi:hypothetical protein
MNWQAGPIELFFWNLHLEQGEAEIVNDEGESKKGN